MALILTNATFNDSEGLEKLIELYKKQSITKFALSSELTIAAQNIIAFNNNIYIEIVDGRTGGKSFGIAVLPKVTEKQMDLYLYIDSALFNILSSKQILEAILKQLENYTEITTEFARFNMKKIDFDVDLVDALIESLRLYKISLEKLHTISNLNKELEGVNCPSMIEEIIEKLEKEEYTGSQAIEILTIGNYLPDQIIDAAKDIVKSSKELSNNLDIKQEVYGSKFEEVPSINYHYNNIKKHTDGTYPMYQAKEIDPNYEPETNQ